MLDQLYKLYDKRKIVSLIKNTGWIFFDKIFRIIAGISVSILIARFLGPSDFGILNYITVFPLMFAAFVNLGLGNILFNEFIARNDIEKNKELFSTSLLLRLMAGLISYILIIIISTITHHTDEALNVLVCISALSLIVQSFDIIDVYFQSQRLTKFSIIPKLIIFFIATLVRLYGLWIKAELKFFVIVGVAEAVSSTLLAFMVYARFVKFNFMRLQIDKTLALYLLKISWPLMISELFLFLYVRVDLLMIKQLSTTAELGNYSVTMRITDLWYFIPVAITTSLAPSLVSMRSTNYAEYLNRYKYLLAMLASISLTISFSVTIFADQFIHLIYGNKYDGVGTILSINIWTGLFVFLAIGSNQWFVIENLQRFILIRTVMGAIINIILNFMLIPRFGAIGASLATLAAQLFASYLINGMYHKTREIFHVQNYALLFIPLFLIKSARRSLAKK